MPLNLSAPNLTELKPRITVIGVGGAGGNAVNNMITAELEGVEFVVANTDAQAVGLAKAAHKVQLGTDVTQGLGAGSRPDIGRAAAEESIEEVMSLVDGSNMLFITAGHGRRHRNRGGASDRGGGAGERHPDSRCRDKAVPVRRRAPYADRGGGHR